MRQPVPGGGRAGGAGRPHGGRDGGLQREDHLEEVEGGPAGLYPASYCLLRALFDQFGQSVQLDEGAGAYQARQVIGR